VSCSQSATGALENAQFIYRNITSKGNALTRMKSLYENLKVNFDEIDRADDIIFHGGGTR